MKTIIASGPVIIEDNKLLVNKDDKDDFYKLPGGTVEEGTEDLEQACHREIKEEINGEIEIIKPLWPHVLWENPTTKEKMTIVLVSYLAKLKNKSEIKPIPPIKEIKWIPIRDILEKKANVSPYTQFVIEKEYKKQKNLN